MKKRRKNYENYGQGFVQEVMKKLYGITWKNYGQGFFEEVIKKLRKTMKKRWNNYENYGQGFVQEVMKKLRNNMEKIWKNTGKVSLKR